MRCMRIDPLPQMQQDVMETYFCAQKFNVSNLSTSYQISAFFLMCTNNIN